MLNTRFSPKPSFSPEEVQAVADVVASNRNYRTSDRCRTFEKRFAEWAGTKHAIALANARSRWM